MGRILVTGSSGFIGKTLVPLLVSKGHNIVVFQRDGAPASMSPDCLSESELQTTKQQFDAIIHLAGLAHVSPAQVREHNLDYTVSNVVLTEKLVAFAKRQKVGTFINLSSIAVVCGSSSAEIISDASPVAPVNEYGASKLAGEEVVQTLERSCLAVSLRPPMVVGKDAKGNWQRLKRLARLSVPLPFGNVHNRRSVISAQSLAQRIAHLLDHPFDTNLSGAYCVCDTPPQSIGDMISSLRAGMGNRALLFPLPGFVFSILNRTPVLGKTLDKIVGDLVLDGRRFDDAFSYDGDTDIRAEIVRSATDQSR